ncbi:MAG: anaerobic ribonucleoside-triphosphate reductase activating protein, partial [Burkholderiales bacterium]|nr:anaerobic ribonucleoside-triphosphate reductase activating protein [Burkholderiales bacterium]
AQVRALGFQTGLHSAGMYPRRLAALLPALDWVGLDIKAPWDAYDALTGVPGSAAKVRESLARLLQSGVDHECRTTWHSALFPGPRLQALADDLAAQGVTHWALQACRLDGRAAALPPQADLEQLGARFRAFRVR